MARQGKAGCGAAGLGEAGQGKARFSHNLLTRLGKAGRGLAGRGEAWSGRARQCDARQGSFFIEGGANEYNSNTAVCGKEWKSVQR